MHELVARHQPLVRFLAEVMGPSTEVVLHDLTDPEQSIVAIENGAVSGRAVGGPVTDLLLKVIHDGGRQDFIANYRATLKGDRSSRSSSYFIRDPKGAIVGVLCVNTDLSCAVELERQLKAFIDLAPPGAAPASPAAAAAAPAPEPAEASEHLHATIDEVLRSMVEQVLGPADGQAKLSPGEKAEIIRRLNDTGLFLLKGGVSEVARRLNISEASVYRYISKARLDQPA